MKRYWRILAGVCLAAVLLFHPLTAQAASGSDVSRYAGKKEVTNKDFSGQSLIGSEFTKLNLEQSNFNDSDIRGSVFNGSLLLNAKMHGADFSNGIAYLTDFEGADLSDANFTEAILLYSTFKNVDITGTDFTNAVLDGLEAKKLCQKATGVNSQTGVSTRESLGCS